MHYLRWSLSAFALWAFALLADEPVSPFRRCPAPAQGCPPGQNLPHGRPEIGGVGLYRKNRFYFPPCSARKGTPREADRAKAALAVTREDFLYAYSLF